MLGGETDDEQFEFEDSLAKVSAHVLACVQSLHAIADIFAHAIYYSLGYNLRPDALPERRVAAHSVRDKLRLTAAHQSLADDLNGLISNEHSEYLGALANQSKHRSLVKPTLWLDMTEVGPEPFTLQFQDFVYDGTFYERREIRPFLASAFNHISRTVVDTGIELNATLRVKSP